MNYKIYVWISVKPLTERIDHEVITLPKICWTFEALRIEIVSIQFDLIWMQMEIL